MKKNPGRESECAGCKFYDGGCMSRYYWVIADSDKSMSCPEFVKKFLSPFTRYLGGTKSLVIESRKD